MQRKPFSNPTFFSRSSLSSGQGTTEYLIILAIVIVIALVVVGVLGGFGSQGGAVTASQSKAYWGALQPLALTDWKISTSTSVFVFKNLSSNAVTLTDINYNGTNTTLASSVALPPGSTYSVSTASVTCSTAGQQVNVRMGYTYDTSTLTAVKVIGQRNLVATCQ